jgi:hypothetical protein
VLLAYTSLFTATNTQAGNVDSNAEIDHDSNDNSSDDNNSDIDDTDDVGGDSSKSVSPVIASPMGKLCFTANALSHKSGIRFADGVFA